MASIVHMGRAAEGVLAARELEDKMQKTLCLGAKDTTVAAANDYHHLGKACVYTADNVIQLGETRETLDRD
jgi:hypothetical protein